MRISVSYMIHVKIGAVLTAFKDYAAYHTWWAHSAKPDPGDDSQMAFSPVPLVRLVLRRRGGTPPKEWIFDYVRGPFRGSVTWLLSENPDNHRMTHIIYTTDVSAKGPFGWLLLQTPFIRPKHIIKTIRKLEQQALLFEI